MLFILGGRSNGKTLLQENIKLKKENENLKVLYEETIKHFEQIGMIGFANWLDFQYHSYIDTSIKIRKYKEDE